MNIPGRQYLLWLAGLVVLEGLSWQAYSHPEWRAPLMLVIGLGLAWLSWRRPAMIVYAGLAELLVGGKGQLLFISIRGQVLSLRYLIFGVAVIIAIRYWRDVWGAWRRQRWLWLPPMCLLGWVMVAVGWGLIQGYPAGRVFTDANAFGMLLAIPVWGTLLVTDQHWRECVWTILAAGLSLIAVKSWLLMVVFGHASSWPEQLYRWVRNTGSGEITPMTKTLYRVFLQSQVYSVVAGVALLGAWLQWRRWGWQVVAWTAAGLSFFISLSRTFWLGAAAAGFAMICLLVLRRSWRSLKPWWPGLPLGLMIGYGLFLWAVNFPAVLPTQGGIGSAVQARLAGANASEAANARRNQIQPLLSEIKHNPIFGRGLGAQARYYNPDPRIKGWRETSAFELGYLDWWLKFGLVGLGLLAWWLWVLLRSAWRSPWAWAVIPSLVALAAIHATSPYLNHPLGLGWLAIMSVLAYERA